MAYLSKVSVPQQWTPLATLLGTSFSEGSTYSIQALENSSVRLCNSTSLPTDDCDGENIKNLMQAIYEPDSGTLYVKTAGTIPAFVVVSQLS